MAVSPATVMVTAKLALRVLSCGVRTNSDCLVMNLPEIPTALPDPYFLRISGTRTPMLSVVTVTFNLESR